VGAVSAEGGGAVVVADSEAKSADGSEAGPEEAEAEGVAGRGIPWEERKTRHRSGSGQSSASLGDL
jgi:hypothetical protein